jgi:ribosomal protein S18 acetylase RimI-like enzyme
MIEVRALPCRCLAFYGTHPASIAPCNPRRCHILTNVAARDHGPQLRISGLGQSVEEHTQRILFRFDCAQIVLVGDEAVGLLKVSRDGGDWYVHQIQLKPLWQGQGLGTWLIQSVIDDARTAGASLRLDVLKANPARRLYERLGFIVVEETPRVYEMRLPA